MKSYSSQAGVRAAVALVLILALALLASPAFAGDRDPLEKVETGYTRAFQLHECTWADTGSNRYFVLEPGYQATLQGEEFDEEEEETLFIQQIITVTDETKLVDGVLTRCVEEKEWETDEPVDAGEEWDDDDIIEISRNYFAICVETGDVFYFGEDVDDIEDGEIVGHEGAWFAGVDGASAGLVMPGRITLGARFYQEFAPGVALDRTEIVAMGAPVETPFEDFLFSIVMVDGSALDPEAADVKFYVAEIGLVVDEDLELVDLVLP